MAAGYARAPTPFGPSSIPLIGWKRLRRTRGLGERGRVGQVGQVGQVGRVGRVGRVGETTQIGRRKSSLVCRPIRGNSSWS